MKHFNEISCLLFYSYICKNIIWNMAIPLCKKDSFFSAMTISMIANIHEGRDKKKKETERDRETVLSYKKWVKEIKEVSKTSNTEEKLGEKTIRWLREVRIA